MNTDFKNTLQISLPKRLNQAFIDKSFELTKWRRFKVGCKPKDCELQEITLLYNILCRLPCYLTEEDIEKLENRLIHITNVK